MSRPVYCSLLLAVFLSAAWAQETTSAPIELSEDSVQALLIRKIPPRYPPLARQARIQGMVILKIVINKDGDVRDLQLVSGHPMLAPAAIEAVKQWKYQPYTKDGEVVEVSTMVRVVFSMPDGAAPKDEAANAPPMAMSGVIGPVSSSSGPIRMSEGVYRVFEPEMRARRIEKIDPVYPPTAVQDNIQGMVRLEVQILPSGDVENVRLISGDPLLVDAATEAVKQWKYRPYVIDGNAVTVITTARLNFTLTESGTGVVSEPEAGVSGVVRSEAGATPRVAVPTRVRVSSGVSQRLLVSKVAPEYPEDARYQRIQGVVLLHVNIDREGNVYNVELISGHPLLAPAAIEAVRQWKYRPYLLNGNAIEVDTQVQVNFTLR